MTCPPQSSECVTLASEISMIQTVFVVDMYWDLTLFEKHGGRHPEYQIKDKRQQNSRSTADPTWHPSLDTSR